MYKSIATLLLVLLIYDYGMGQLGGYLFSVFVRGEPYLFAAVPLMNVMSWIAVDASLILVSIWCLRRHFDIHVSGEPFANYYVVLTVVALIGLPIGLLYEWPTIGVVADVVYLLGGVAIYFVTQAALRADRYFGFEQGGLLRQWLFASCFWALASTACYFTGFSNGALGAHFPSVLIVSLLYNLAFRNAMTEVVILAAPLLLHLKEMNRTTLVQVLAAAAQFAFAGGAHRLLIRSLPVLCLGVVLALTLSKSAGRMLDISESPLGQRLSQISEFSFDPQASKEVAVSQRFYEAQAVLSEYDDAGPLTWLIGFGAGSTFDMKDSRDDSVRAGSILGENRVHNIHLLPVAFFFRHGLLGLTLIVYFAVVAVATFINVGRRAAIGRASGFELIAAVFIVQALIEGMAAASHFVTNPVVAFMAAYSDHLRTVSRPAAFAGRRSPLPSPPIEMGGRA
jgi:hypothetical protein